MSVLVNAMKTETEIRQEIEALRNLTTAQLKEKYREVFGEETRSNHKQFLFRRIACASRPTPGAVSPSAPAAARWRSPTTPIFASARPRTSCANPPTTGAQRRRV
jgi:hypothetical protein